jgi:Fe-S oxidoreductase
MRTNQLLGGILNDQGVDLKPFVSPSDPDSYERVAAALLTTEDEYERITTQKVKGDGRLLFFSGCNIYYQPNLLLTALDFLEVSVDGWSFLPGLELCCGSNHDSAGRLNDGSEAIEILMRTMMEGEFEGIVVWCSTCALRLRQKGFQKPVMTFARLVADNLADQLRDRSLHGGVTLQEPCKDAYMDMDTDAPREVLGMLAGEPVREMIHHGRDTVCCGWALSQHRPEAWAGELLERLDEARATGARTMATVCHGCQWLMDRPFDAPDVSVVNYITLVGEALGISHPERFSVLRKSGTVEDALTSIQREMGSRFDQLPFEEGRIRETVGILMGAFYGT